MQAVLLLRERIALDESRFVDAVIWRLPTPARGSHHAFKYRLALVIKSECVLRYDNEDGKGDHKHIGAEQVPYRFADLDQLLADFWTDVEKWGLS